MIPSVKQIATFILLCLSAQLARSQKDQVYHINFIGISLTELPFLDFRVSYERKITPSHGLKLEVSYKPVLSSFTDATNINLGQAPTAWCYRNTARWIYASLGYRYYFGRSKTFYVSPEIFYKTMVADKIVYTYGVGGGGSSTLTNVYQLRSMNCDMAGLNILIGKKLRIRFSDGFNLGFDIFSGLTLRSKVIRTTIYGSNQVSYYHDSPPLQVYIPSTDIPLESRENPFQIFVQFGIIIFVSW